jgi:dipeptidyl aminopeptidase/acylaminoacyl peptidase
MKRMLLIPILAFAWSAIFSQEILIDRWLTAGGINVYMPALAETENVKGDKFKPIDLLKTSLIDLSTLAPQKGKQLAENTILWEEKFVDKDSSLYFSFNGKGNRIGFLAVYLKTENFWKGKLAVESTAPFEAYFDNSKTTERYSSCTEGTLATKEVKLIPGAHKLIIKVFISDTITATSRLKVYLKPTGEFLPDGIIVSTDPQETKTLKHLLEGPKLSSVNISAAGDMALVTISEVNTENDKNSWFRKVVRLSDNKVLATYRQSEISQLQWMPKGNKLSYLSSGNLWYYDFDKGIEIEALKGLNEISGYNWSPTEEFVIYSVSEKDDGKKGEVRRILTMEDRQPNWRSRSFLYIGHVASGKHERLTWGNRSTWLQDIAPDGSNILFSISQEDYSERPYRKQSLLRLDLPSRKADTLWIGKLFGVGVSYSPDGKKLLVTGAPLAFGNIGVNVSSGKIPNGYDNQAYIYDISSGTVDPIALNFNPSIISSWWCPITNNIYFNTEDEDKQTVYIYNAKTKGFSPPLKLNEEIVLGIDFARQKQVAVYSGSGMRSWPKAYQLDLKSLKSTIIDNPDGVNYSHVKLGETKEWTFTSTAGQKVSCRYYLPPNFDATKKYPMIVYYYGGTSPVGREFGGRYPKQHYAANGFVVLVLQPSGATGFGQDFSAAHVNAWGEITADEIIEGTKKFSQEHAFVDSKKIGCIGASYGGFMTMYLLTRTDIFAAAISHAGISSISSYWGEGYWGYSYSAEASANSFPWNNRELYVDRSPLFNADKVVTPLLLLHGSDDTNVPVGESIQMFTALKLLGKTAEFIQVDGANHSIQKYSQRVQWTNTIMAWFSKYLKEEDGWWKEMYPDVNY